jgi:tetratricopeptide (TPR) repeat protein
MSFPRTPDRPPSRALLPEQATAVEPDSAEDWHALGIAAYRSGNISEAITRIKRAITIEPNVAPYHANLGELHRLAGRVDEAIVSSRRALEIKPDFPAALSNLGIALFDQGKFDEALAQYDRAIALQDDFAQAHSNRGNALLRLKRFSEAEFTYRRAVALQPGFADAWNNLGTCLRELKRPADAETVYRKSLELDPSNAQTLDNLALALKDLERLEEAAELLRQALLIEQSDSRIYLHYGAVLLDQHSVEAAAAAAERALFFDPDNYECVNLVGRVAFERGNLESSLDHHRRALALNPDFAETYNDIGNVLKELGRSEEAEKAYRESIRVNPSIAGVYVNLVDLKKLSHGDRALLAMEALEAKKDELSKTDRLRLDFAFGKVFADLKDFDRSFARLVKANAAKRSTVSYNEGETIALFERIEVVFTAEMIRARSGGGYPSPAPIFVIGMPRSGTTLAEQIIASHPMVHGGGELQALSDIVLAVRGPNREKATYPEFVEAIDPSGLRQIGAGYLARLRELAPLSERVTNKMPSNYYFVGLIHLALPDAKILHCRRDPIDTCVSCFSKLFSQEQNHTYDLGELGRYYRRYERLMAHWRQVLPEGRMLDVQYEDIVADLEGEARRIIAYCGLDWDPRCLAFHETKRPVRTASATQVRQPLYRSAVGRWRAYEKHLGPLFEALDVTPSA